MTIAPFYSSSIPTGITIGHSLSGTSLISPVYFSTCTIVPVQDWDAWPEAFGACKTFGSPPRSMPVASSMRIQAPSAWRRNQEQWSQNFCRTKNLAVGTAHKNDIAVLDATLFCVDGRHEALLRECFAQANDIVVYRVGAAQRMRSPEQQRIFVGLSTLPLFGITLLPFRDRRMVE